MWFVMSLLLVLFSTPDVAADGTRVQDPNDQPKAFRLDIDWASDGHDGRQLSHKIRTYESWSPRVLRSFAISFEFSTTSPHTVNDIERCINVRFRNGRLKGTLMSGRYCSHRLDGAIRVTRPGSRSLRVRFDRSLLGPHPDAYEWVTTTYYAGNCAPEDPSCGTDFAPQRGLRRHGL